VALERSFILVEEFLDAGAVKPHSDAIYHLKLVNPVLRPVSLQQIRMQHRIREGGGEMTGSLVSFMKSHNESLASRFLN
jgi:hypothetical protein